MRSECQNFPTRRMNLRFLVFLLFSISAIGQNEPIATPTNGEKDQKDLQGEAVFLDGMKLFLAENYEASIPKFKTVIERFDGDAGVSLMLAKAYEKNNQLDLASLAAKEAALKDKQNLSILKYNADLMVINKEYKNAIAAYKTVIKEKPDYMDAYIGLTNLYLLQNDYSNAIKAYDLLEENIGIDEEVTRQKQLLYLKINKVDEALKEGERLIESEPLEPEFVIQQAQLMLNNGKVGEAQKMLEQSVERNPEFAEGHVILAEIYRKQGDLKACNTALLAAFNNKTLSVDTKLKILGSYMELLKNQTSIESTDDLISLNKKLIELDPEDARGYVFLGDLLVKKNEIEAARDSYVKSTKYDRSVFDVWLAIIELDNRLNDTKSMVKHATQAADYFPNQSFFWYNAGLGNFVLKDFEESVYQLDEAKMLAFDNPELLKNILTIQGDAYNELKQYSESELAYEEALKIDPEYETALNNYSYFLASRNKDLALAKKLSAKLLNKNPSNIGFMDTHAWVLFKMGEYDRAKELLSEATKSENVNSTILEHYGDVLSKSGNTAEALIQWKKALEMGGDSEKINQKISTGAYID